MPIEYASLASRVKAAFIDAVILIVAMYAASEILSWFENIHDYVRIIIAVCLFVIYEPLFISYFGATIGHSFAQIEVRRDIQSIKKVPFPVAIVRFILKVFLGWISLLTITGNSKKKAIHDFVANSIVVEDHEK